MHRFLLTTALCLCCIAQPVEARHRGKPVRAAKAGKSEAGKRGSRDGTALFEAMASANRAVGALEQVILDVQDAGDDSRKIKEIADSYETLREAMRGELADKVAELTKPERKQLDAYRKSKLAPLEQKWARILGKVQDAVAVEVTAQVKGLRNQIEDLLAECDGIIAQTRSAGADSSRRADLLQRMNRLQGAVHSLYHDAAKVPGRANATALTREIAQRLDVQVRRADWLLRTAIQPPCADFTAQLQTLHKQVQELDGLAADIGLAVNRAGLAEAMAKRGQLMLAIQATTGAPLTPEEAAELRAVADELLVPVQAHLDEAQATAEARLGGKGHGRR